MSQTSPETAIAKSLADMVKAIEDGAVRIDSPNIGGGDPEIGYEQHYWHEEWLHYAKRALGLAQTPAEPGMQGAVQYRRKDGGYGPGWITMAMFDGTLAAENYLAIQRKDENCPYEYRAIELPAVSDTSTTREGK